MKPFKQTLNNQPVLVNHLLEGWTIYHRQSSYVAYIAVNPGGDSLFIQFNNGTCFIYPGLPIDLIKEAIAAESIGKFFHAQLKGKYEGEAVESHCIQPDEEEDEDEGYEDFLGPHDAAFEGEH